MLLSHEAPVNEPSADAWTVTLTTKRNGVPAVPLGTVVVAADASILAAPQPADVLAKLRADAPEPAPAREAVSGERWEFRHGDGIAAAAELPDRRIDLLLTDPPYGISQRYTCESTDKPQDSISRERCLTRPCSRIHPAESCVCSDGAQESALAPSSKYNGEIKATTVNTITLV